MNARLVETARGARQSLHHHEGARAIIILRGALIEDTFGDAARYAPGDVLVRPAYFPHANEAGLRGAAYVQLPLAPAAARRLARGRGWRPLRGRWEGWRASSPGGLTDCEALFAALERTAPTMTPANYTPAFDANSAFEAVTRSSAPLGEIATVRGLRPFAFTRLFTARYGMAPRAYRRRARLHRAMNLIAQDTASLAMIAAESGFSDQSHLTKAMNREIGLTPGAFRRLVSG